MDHAERKPAAYFITFTTYGTWLHGNAKGSVDPKHNQFEAPRRQYEKHLSKHMQTIKEQETILLNGKCREVVMKAIQSTCKHYDWHLYAVHVRSNHVHLVVKAEVSPERVMNQLKAYASRALNIHSGSHKKYWTRHGSTRYIWTEKFILPAMQYVIDQQGSRMSCYYETWYDQC